jgi:hypothetical protein
LPLKDSNANRGLHGQKSGVLLHLQRAELASVVDRMAEVAQHVSRGEFS